MKRNLLPLVIAMLFVTGTAFAQETPQPADGVVEAPVSPEAAVGSSDCCNPCCDPCDPCCNQRQGFLLECELDAVVKQPVVTSVRQRFKQPAVILVIHAATSVKVSLHACEIAAVVKQQLAVMIARLPLKRPAAILVIPAATNVKVSLHACEIADVVNPLATHAKRLQWPCLK